MADQRVTELSPIVTLDVNARTAVRNPGDTRDKYATIQQIIDEVPSSGTGIAGKWLYDNPVAEADPGSGFFRINNLDPALATEMYISTTTEPGGDFSTLLGALAVDDKFYIQNLENSGEAILATVVATTDNTTWFKIEFTVDDSQGASFTDGQPFGALFVYGLGGGGGGGLPEFQFFADQMQNPVTADWAVNALAPAAADNINTGIPVRQFDDTTEEGIGFILEVPTTAVNIVLGFKSRAQVAPAAARTVGLNLYQRGMPDNAGVEAWSAGTQLVDIDIPNNNLHQDDSQSITLASLGITAGEITQFELTRINPTGGTELVGDWNLALVKVSFT